MRTRAAELLHLYQEIVAPALSALILNQADLFLLRHAEKNLYHAKS